MLILSLISIILVDLNAKHNVFQCILIAKNCGDVKTFSSDCVGEVPHKMRSAGFDSSSHFSRVVNVIVWLNGE